MLHRFFKTPTKLILFYLQDFKIEKSEKSEEEIPPTNCPKPILPKNFVPNTGIVNIVDMHPMELARQLALLNWSMYKKVQYYEFWNYLGCWSPMKYKERFPNLLAMIKFFDEVEIFFNLKEFICQFQLWVGTQILIEKDLENRANKLQHFVKMMIYSLELRNFTGFYVILVGLSSYPISRLKKTWKVSYKI